MSVIKTVWFIVLCMATVVVIVNNIPLPTKMKTAKTKAWAVCFALSKKCMQGDLAFFAKKSYARRYIKILHKEIGGLEDDHHIIPCTISFITPKKTK